MTKSLLFFALATQPAHGAGFPARVVAILP
jgi:kynurenine formamidase